MSGMFFFYDMEMIDVPSSLVNMIVVLWVLLDSCYKLMRSVTSDKALQVLVALCSVNFADFHADECKVCMQKTVA